MSQGDLDVSVSETESEFEYINKESEELVKAEQTDSCGKVVELQDLVAEVMEIEKEINAEASNIVEFSSKNISDQPLFLQPMEDENDLELKEDDEEKLVEIVTFDSGQDLEKEIGFPSVLCDTVTQKCLFSRRLHTAVSEIMAKSTNVCNW